MLPSVLYKTIEEASLPNLASGVGGEMGRFQVAAPGDLAASSWGRGGVERPLGFILPFVERKRPRRPRRTTCRLR